MMPNWCFCNITIERNDISKKQFKKLYKRLIKSDNPFDSIIDIDYSSLYKLDKLNTYLANNEEIVELIDYILGFLCEKENLELINTKEIIKDMYKRIRNGEYLHLYGLDNKIKNISNTLFNHYKNNMKNKETKTSYVDNSDKFTFSNLFPDNPVALIRREYLSEQSFLDIDDIKINVKTDDLYNDRIDNRYGTKWDASDSTIEYFDDYISINTECAWGPCEIFCKNLVELYDVTITIQYEESGWGFIGLTKFYTDDDNDVQTEEIYYSDQFEDTFDFDYTRLLLDCDFNVSTEDIIQLIYDCIEAELIDEFEDFDYDELTNNSLKELVNNNKEFRIKLIKFLDNKKYLDYYEYIKDTIKYIKSLIDKPKDRKIIKVKRKTK